MTLSAMQEKGQVTIPADIRKKLGLKKGDLIGFMETDEGIVITPLETVTTDSLDKIGKILKDKGITLQELIESSRKIRKNIVKRL
ncbi:MAG: AbrB/MazE/SpoVT family DNA-binding domain-containing protein [Candidatus Levybacteria bacterium]|nr:AbrB/MazE/SpoVT family DNA-binding domain-containing protein [Candidatus Levybacteria bacterium]